MTTTGIFKSPPPSEMPGFPDGLIFTPELEERGDVVPERCPPVPHEVEREEERRDVDIPEPGQSDLSVLMQPTQHEHVEDDVRAGERRYDQP